MMISVITENSNTVIDPYSATWFTWSIQCHTNMSHRALHFVDFVLSANCSAVWLRILQALRPQPHESQRSSDLDASAEWSEWYGWPEWHLYHPWRHEVKHEAWWMQMKIVFFPELQATYCFGGNGQEWMDCRSGWKWSTIQIGKHALFGMPSSLHMWKVLLAKPDGPLHLTWTFCFSETSMPWTGASVQPTGTSHIFSRWLQNHLHCSWRGLSGPSSGSVRNAISSRMETEMFEDFKAVLQRPWQSLEIVHCREVVVPDKPGSCSRRGCVTCHQWLLSGAER